jgi:TonB-dependent starch-binding outer membrane protein SusC
MKCSFTLKKNSRDRIGQRLLMWPKALAVLLLTLFTFNTFAQSNLSISGRVSDETGQPLPNVSVIIKGGDKGVNSDESGSYGIKAPAKATLIFSSVGYTLKEIEVNNRTVVNVTLSSASKQMEQIVVVGYGTQKRALVTGAVGSVSGKILDELPVPGIDQALQGRVAGVTVTNNGAPGTAPIVRIRGISSITQNSDPLYVIDGFPTGGLLNFDSRDIESVDVLKDASAAAIYGSRASNGVIIITTKKGRRDGKLQVSLDSYIGLQQAANKLDLLNTSQYVKYERMLNGAAGIGLPPRLQPENFNQPIYDGATQTYAQTNTDWQDAFFKKGLITQHNIGLSGGNGISRFYSSAGYFKQEGITPAVGYERFNVRLNSDHRINRFFTVGENLYLAYGNQNRDFTDNEGNRSKLMNIIRMPPYLPVHDPTSMGGFKGPNNSFDASDPVNPVEYSLIGSHTNKTVKLLGTAFLDINFTNWLKARTTFGIDHSNDALNDYTPIYNDGGTSSGSLAALRNRRNLYTSLLFSQQLTFDKTFGVHHLNVIGVYEQQSGKSLTEDATGTQNTNEVKTLSGATISGYTGRTEENFIMSVIGRVQYDYAGKYILSGSIRRDGLSVWATGHKWATFPAGSVGWRIDQENFMKSVSAVSELKVRAGYGLVGLNGTSLGNYPWQVTLQQNAYYPFNNSTSSGSNSAYYNTLGNQSLEWETTKQLNLGFDLGLYQNKITLSAEWFNRRSDNLILNVPTPFSFGFASAGVRANVGKMENKGLEIQLGLNETWGAYKNSLTLNFATVNNKVLALNTSNSTIDAGGDPDFGGGTQITRTVAGQPVQSFYGYVVEGIFQNEAEIAAHAVQVAGTDPTKSTAPGDLKFKDLSGPDGKPDGVIDDNDRTFLGSYIPKYSYGINYTANFKNFDLSVFFQGVQGNKIFNGTRIISEGMSRLFNSGTAVLNSWTTTNTNTDIPRAISGDPNRNTRPSTRWIEDGSYMRLKNVILGYNFSDKMLSRLTKGTVSRFHVYVSAFNLLTFTKYTGLDPEVGARNLAGTNGTLTNGIDYGQYPAARSYQVGVQVNF